MIGLLFERKLLNRTWSRSILSTIESIRTFYYEMDFRTINVSYYHY
jgi:hypothetical protein